MRNTKSIVIITLIAILTFGSCKENDDPVSPNIPPENVYQYFPSYPLKYDLFELRDDTTKIGFREVYFLNDTLINNTNYTEYRISYNNIIEQKYFRRTDRGLYFLFDSTYIDYFSDYIPPLGDSLKLVYDREMNYLSLPPQDSLSWNVAKVNIVYNNLLVFTVVSLKATLIEKSNFISDTLGLNIPSLKYNYELRVVVPEEDLTLPPTEYIFNAQAEYGIEVGLLNFAGDSIIIDFMFGKRLSVIYRNRKILQMLTSASDLHLLFSNNNLN
ncbi:MAG: hypothetical protein J5I57_02105 [Melioribacteraceae bacterium]|nr:hypothetical protein [Melioribacteraceae bacterium]